MYSMRLSKLNILFLLALLIFLFPGSVYSQTDKNLYYQGTRRACRGQSDLAFMSFYKLSNSFPESKYLQATLFAMGEYYFSISDYADAKQTFNQFNNNYPESEARPFAIAYLMKVAQNQGRQNLAEKYRRELIGLRQFSLLFREFKELQYASPLCNNYKALNFIDKIEIYIDDKLFAKISF